jgi:tetratricopeptide (TPR) repeat protein
MSSGEATMSEAGTSSVRAARRPGLRRAIGLLLVALVGFAPVAVGTVHEWTRAVVFVGCALALALTLLERRLTGKRLGVTWPLLALALATVLTALQLVPLPAAALAVIVPPTHEVLSLWGGYAAHPLSLDPPATVAELAKLGAYLGFFTAAVTFASRSARRRQLLLAVAGTATLVAIIGLVQAALGARDILFLYEPRQAWLYHIRGTFVNPNHFGALLCLGAPAAMVLGMRQPTLRWAAYAATFLIDVAVVLSMARATIVAAFLGQAVVLVVDQVQVRRGTGWLASRGASSGALTFVAVAGIGVAVAVGANQLHREITHTASLEELHDPLSKIHMWEQTTRLVAEYPWTGVGRGAFEVAFPRVSEVGGRQNFQFVENGYLQSVVDWGIPATAVLLVLAACSLVVAVRRLREDPLALGALAGVVALAVHEAADFSVELPGVALPALALLATLFARSSSARSSPAPRPPGAASTADPPNRLSTRLSNRLSIRLPIRPAYLLVPAVLLVPLIVELRLPSIQADEDQLLALVADAHATTPRVVAFGEEARARHPSDYFLYDLVGERLARQQNPQSLRWLNAAMYLNPTHPSAHLMAAEMLGATHHKAQALIEYRLAAAGDRDPKSMVWPYAMRRYPALEDMIAATPDNPPYLAALGKFLANKGRPADAEKVYQLVIDRDPGNVPALTRLAQLALDRRDGQAAARVQALLAVDRSVASLRLAVRERILARDLVAAGQLLDAIVARLDRSAETLQVGLELASADAASGRLDEARARTDDLASWQLDRASRALVHTVRADIERRAGNEHQRRWELEQVERLQRERLLNE